MNPIRISVVIPTYNRPELIKRAIRSVLREKSTHLCVEVIVVDDCSETPPNLLEFEGEPMQYIRLALNAGPQIARNTGISISSADWILMLDDDDELIPGMLYRAINQVQNIADYQQYPVFFFATTKGHIPSSYQIIRPVDLMDGTLTGDFTPLLQQGLFRKQELSYLNFPEIHGVGCEQLTWLDISSKFGIPAFMRRVVKVNHDAPMRLTSYDNFIRNSYKFALQQDITVEFIRQKQLHQLSPRFVDKKILGAAIYYLVSGNKERSRKRIRSLERTSYISRMLSLLSYLPAGLSRILFLAYKRTYGNN